MICLLTSLCILVSRINKGIRIKLTCVHCRTAKEKSKTSGKLMDRSISPLPNPPAGQSLKFNKLTGSLRSQSPSQAGRPPKKKKKASNKVVLKEETTTSLQVTSHDPVMQQDVSSGHLKIKSDRPKPQSSSYTTSHASFSSSLSSSESDMEEVSMPTITYGNSTMVTAASADGNGMLGSLKKSSDHDSSSGSDTSSSESQSDDDSDEVILHHMMSLMIINTRTLLYELPEILILRILYVLG